MNLGHGFVKGNNKITKQKVQYWLHVEKEINWKAFLWYITQYVTITDYDENSFNVDIYSENQREDFYRKIRNYNDEMACYNYNIDKENDLYKSHNRGYKQNKDIIEKLIRD